jgi:CRP-like cAMP-binding protein
MLTISQLVAFPIFDGIPRDIMDRIGQAAQALDYEANAVIFREGQEASHLYGVMKGEVELSILFRDRVMRADVQYEDYVRKHVEIIEKEIVIEDLGPGEVFSWSALSAPHRLTSTATCCRPTSVFALEASRLKAVLAQAPAVGYLFMQRVSEIIARRLRNRTNKLLESWYEAFEVENV